MPSSLPTASLLRNRDFALVWSAGLVSWTGNLAMFVALPVAVYARTDSTLATATAVLGGALPPVLVSQVAGVVADRVDRRRLMLWTNVALAGLTTSYVVLAEASWWTLVLANLVISSVGQLIGPAEQALLPDLVDDATRLGEAASLNTLNNSLARLIGPAIGGLLFAHFGFWATALLDAATYLVAAGLMAMVSRRRGPTAPAASEQPEPLRVLWAQGAKVVRRNPRLRVLVLLGALVMFGEGYVSALLAPFTKEILGGGAQTLGWMLSAQAVGGSLGAWWATKVVDRHDPLRLLGIAGVISGVLLAGIFNYAYLYPHPWPAIAMTAAAGAPFAVFLAAKGTALLVYSPPHMRGRIYSISWGLSSLFYLLGIASAGLAGDAVGLAVINIDAIAYLAAGLVALWAANQVTSSHPQSRDPV